LAGLKGCGFLFNGRRANSGMHRPRAIATLPMVKTFLWREHGDSRPACPNIERTALGEADATCVDGVTYAILLPISPTQPRPRRPQRADARADPSLRQIAAARIASA